MSNKIPNPRFSFLLPTVLAKLTQGFVNVHSGKGSATELPSQSSGFLLLLKLLNIWEGSQNLGFEFYDLKFSLLFFFSGTFKST